MYRDVSWRQRRRARLFRLAAPPVAVAAAAAAILVGCSGSGGGPTQTVAPAANALSRAVRVAVRFSQPAPQGYLEAMDPTVRQKREAEGVVFEPTRVTYPEMPAVGYYLKVGDRMIAGGPNGEFFLPKEIADAQIPADVPLYKQLSDANPVGTVQIAGQLQPATAPMKTVYFTANGRVLGGPALMDGTTPSRIAGKLKEDLSCCTDDPKKAAKGRAVIDDGCPRYECDTTSNDQATGCCLDYDVTKGRIRAGDEGEEENEGEQGSGDCLSRRVAELYDTECYRWTVGSGGYTAECWNEQAYWQVVGAQSCWSNHKYRFCQNMDAKDFNAAAGGTTVTVGSTVPIIVRNNTPKYDTAVTLSGDADGAIRAGNGVVLGTFYGATVQHYDDASTTHHAVRTVVYEAPAELPDGVTEAYDTLTFEAGGNTKTITLRVVQKCRDSRGREVPCK